MEDGPVVSVGKTWPTIQTKHHVWLSFDSIMREAVKGVVINAILIHFFSFLQIPVFDKGHS